MTLSPAPSQTALPHVDAAERQVRIEYVNQTRVAPGRARPVWTLRRPGLAGTAAQA